MGIDTMTPNADQHIYHVAREHPSASDANPGTEAAPFRTIGRAAQLAEPGDTIRVHSGVYREKELGKEFSTLTLKRFLKSIAADTKEFGDG